MAVPQPTAAEGRIVVNRIFLDRPAASFQPGSPVRFVSSDFVSSNRALAKVKTPSAAGAGVILNRIELNDRKGARSVDPAPHRGFAILNRKSLEGRRRPLGSRKGHNRAESHSIQNRRRSHRRILRGGRAQGQVRTAKDEVFRIGSRGDDNFVPIVRRIQGGLNCREVRRNLDQSRADRP